MTSLEKCLFSSSARFLNWSFLGLFYLLFCVTSEIALSPVDLASMWRGFFVIVFFIILFNLIPGFHYCSLLLTDLCAPSVFFIHTVLVFVLLIDVLFYLFFKIVVKLFKR